MIIVQAYKANDGALFESKDDYLQHQRHLSAIKAKETKAQRAFEKKLVLIQKIQDESSTFDELCNNVVANWRDLCYGTEYSGGRSKLISMRLTRMEYSSRASNSHKCPRGGVTNWSRVDGLPLGYPGWEGRIHLEVEGRTTAGWSNDPLATLGIYSGTGGNGSYHVTIFASDFAGLSKEIMWDILSK